MTTRNPVGWFEIYVQDMPGRSGSTRPCSASGSIGQYGFVALAQDTEGNMIGLHSVH